MNEYSIFALYYMKYTQQNKRWLTTGSNHPLTYAFSPFIIHVYNGEIAFNCIWNVQLVSFNDLQKSNTILHTHFILSNNAIRSFPPAQVVWETV